MDSAAANQDHYDGRTSFSPLHREDQVEESHYPVVLRGADAVGEMLQLVARLVLSYALFSFLINCLCSALHRLRLPKEAGDTYTNSASLSPLAITFQTRITKEYSPVGGREWKGIEKGHTDEDGSSIYGM